MILKLTPKEPKCFRKLVRKKPRKKGSGATQLEWKIYKGSPRVKYFKLNLIFQKIGVKKTRKKGVVPPNWSGRFTRVAPG